jgi:exodeoxyribonuclease V alpha subunit
MTDTNIDLEKIYEFKVVINDRVYYNEDSSFGIYSFSCKEEQPYLKKSDFSKNYIGTVLGSMQELEIGLDYNLKGKLKYSPKYKEWQYNAIQMLSEKPSTLQQQKRFLETLCTEGQCESLLSAYPNIVEDIMQNKEIDLTLVKGIKDKTFQKIKDKVINNYIIQDILVLLRPIGVTFNLIKKLIDDEENPILLKKKILENPYILTKVHGLGFIKVDGIALKLNPKLRVSEERVKAFLNYKLKEIGNSEGHVWISRKELLGYVRKDIKECEQIYKDFLAKEEKNSTLLYLEDEKIGLMASYKIAENILKKIYYYENLESMLEPFTKEDIEISIANTEIKQGFKFTEEQKNAIRSANDHNVIVISGSAGSGKSSVLKGLLDLMSNAKIKEEFLKTDVNQLHEEEQINNPFMTEKYSIEENLQRINIGQSALSAKASKRMKEATGRDAITMHRMLSWSGDGFTHKESFPMMYHVNGLDEVSMINDFLVSNYLNAVKPHSKLILVFDFAQLEAIGMGDFARDILRSKLCIHRFTQVHRQGQDSGILMDANKVRKGINPIEKPEPKIIHGKLNDMYYLFEKDREKIQEKAINIYMKTIKEIGIENVCIVTPRKKECTNSADEINKKIQDLLIGDNVPFLTRVKDGKKMRFKLGAKVMQKVNNYEEDKMVFNGDEGYITSMEKFNFVVTFNLENGKKDVKYTLSELDQIELSYAISVHSAQGSGWHTVISVFDMSSVMLLNRKILYTTMTRSEKRHLLIAQPQAFKACIDDKHNKLRNTFLGDMFEEYQPNINN